MIEVFGLAIGAGATFGYYQYLERVYKKKVRQVKQYSVKFKMLQKVVSKYENLFRPVKDTIVIVHECQSENEFLSFHPNRFFRGVLLDRKAEYLDYIKSMEYNFSIYRDYQDEVYRIVYESKPGITTKDYEGLTHKEFCNLECVLCTKLQTSLKVVRNIHWELRWYYGKDFRFKDYSSADVRRFLEQEG